MFFMNANDADYLASDELEIVSVQRGSSSIWLAGKNTHDS